MFIEILGKCVARWSPTWGAGAIVVALAVPSPVDAGTIHSNLGPGSTFFCCSAIIGARVRGRQPRGSDALYDIAL